MRGEGLGGVVRGEGLGGVVRGEGFGRDGERCWGCKERMRIK